jgi:DNA-binding transcriptional ArsR family regulator
VRSTGFLTLVKTLKAIANPMRLKIIASLASESKHAYALVKELGLSYPLKSSL